MIAVPASHEDLHTSDVAILATVGKDGTPQVTAIWFLYDQGEIRLSLNTSRQKVKNLREHPAATLFLLDRANPYRTLEIRGRVTIEPDDSYAFADTLGAKYGADVRAHDQPGESRVIVTLHPTKINAIAMGG